MTASVNPRSITDEAPFIPASLEELACTRAKLLASGLSLAEVNGVIGWLVAKADGQVDTSNAVTRSKYRRILRDLGAPPTGRGPDFRKGRHVTRPEGLWAPRVAEAA